MRHGSTWLCLLLAGVLCASPATAQTGQTSPQQDKKAATGLAERGWKHYEAGQYTEAVDAFREAEAKAHSPAFLLMIARSNDKLGRLLDARATYQLIADEKLAPGAPSEFTEAKKDAKKELISLEPRIPTVEIAAIGAPPKGMEVEFDGKKITPPTTVPCEPGHHTLVALAPGRKPRVESVPLAERDRKQLKIDPRTLEPLPPPDLSAVQTATSEARPGTQGPPYVDVSCMTAGCLSPERRTTVLISGSAAAGLGLAAGAVLMILSFERDGYADDLREELIAGWNGERRCPSGDVPRCEDLKDAVLASHDFKNAAIWSFVAGGAVGAGTAIFALITKNTPSSSARPQASPFVTRDAAGLSIRGTF